MLRINHQMARLFMDVKSIPELWGVGVVKIPLSKHGTQLKIFLSHWCHNKNVKIESFEKNLTDKREGLWDFWSGRRDSNPRLQPWQGCALPLSYARFT